MFVTALLLYAKCEQLAIRLELFDFVLRSPICFVEAICICTVLLFFLMKWMSRRNIPD